MTTCLINRFACAALLALLPALGSAQSGPASPAPTLANGAASAAQPEPAGEVALIEGDVRFFDVNRVARRPGLGDPIFPGERIVTGSDGEVQISMTDEGYIGVRPGTKMRIAAYKADGGPDDRSVFGLLEGSFRAVTGWIGRYNRQNILVNTPSATIGIRGTDYEPLVLPQGSPLGEPGTYDRVYAGETVLRTAQGTVSVRPNQAAFASRTTRLAPRILARIPSFFRPTRNEARFRGLHERIQRQIEQKRNERIKQIRERRNKERRLRERNRPGGPGKMRERRREQLRGGAPIGNSHAAARNEREVQRQRQLEQRQAERRERALSEQERRRRGRPRRETDER